MELTRRPGPLLGRLPPTRHPHEEKVRPRCCYIPGLSLGQYKEGFTGSTLGLMG